MKIKYFAKNDYSEYSRSQVDFNVSKIMQTQIYKLVYYSLTHIIIYIILLALVNSSFGKRLWNSIVTRFFKKEFEPKMNDSVRLEASVESENQLIKELNRKHSRKYIMYTYTHINS